MLLSNSNKKRLTVSSGKWLRVLDGFPLATVAVKARGSSECLLVQARSLVELKPLNGVLVNRSAEAIILN
jgi:hypothetical protein